ncbi:MAG: hypothetical protein GZ088_12655 [Acidipila sp.]|nr:hypothetical protein [Acidipila sp.]
MNSNSRKNGEQGIALVTAMLILLLLSALLAAFSMLVMTDQGVNGMDRDQSVAFYAAYGGMEKMTADLGALFNANYAASAAQVNAITAIPPPFTGINYIDPRIGGAGSGYAVTFPVDPNGNPLASNGTISKGPYQGFIGLITPFTMTVTASSLTGSEVRLRRTLETVAIPVFQFGIFSQTDLSYFPGPVFNFGGRVHTNGNLFLASGATLTLSDKVSAVGEVVRTNLSNGWLTSANYTGNVDITTAPGTPAVRTLRMNEGSLVGTLGSAANPNWPNISYSNYNSNLRNGLTGAKPLNLALTMFGANPIEMIKLPLANENVNNPQLFALRYFTQSSLRILLADTAAELTGLPTACAAPVALSGVVPGALASVPPFAKSGGNAANGDWTVVNTPLIGGFITIEMQNNAGNCVDVTKEILRLGIAGRNLSNGTLNTPGGGCADPNPNAVIRVQRVQDVPQFAGALGFCGVNGGVVDTDGRDYWPNVLYDTREGTLRDAAPAFAPNVMYAGIMSYIELDVNNLARWFTGNIGASGPNAINLTGYTVYFSDRRNNVVDPVVNRKTGEFGFEDFVNPGSATGQPNNNLDTGEDLDGTGNLVTYGQVPSPLSPSMSNQLAANTPAANTTVWSGIDVLHARGNAPIFFRRALKMVNGQTINLGNCSGGTVPCGLTVAAENPVYLQGSYNATGNSFNGAHVATAVLADAFTLLSGAWNDIQSFTSPYLQTNRNAITSWYRVAVIAGKGISFPQPAGTAQDFGTDGGVHNFLRYLEDWSGQTLNYRGSIVSFYYNRQAVGTFKCCNTVYSPPTRGYNFDVEFLQPSLLPPKTPMFRDVDITGFSQLIMPNQ